MGYSVNIVLSSGPEAFAFKFLCIQNSTSNVLHSGPRYCMYSKQTLALRQASEESACFLLSFFCEV